MAHRRSIYIVRDCSWNLSPYVERFGHLLNALSYPINTNWTVRRDATKGRGLDALKNAPTMHVALNMAAAFYIILSDNVAPRLLPFRNFSATSDGGNFFKITSEMKIKWSEIHRRVDIG